MPEKEVVVNGDEKPTQEDEVVVNGDEKPTEGDEVVVNGDGSTGDIDKSSSSVEQLITDASQLELDKASFNKIQFDDASSIDAYSIPWNKAWNTLVSEAVNESKAHWKDGDTEPWPFDASAIELHSGGLRSSTNYSSLVIPLMMTGQSDKVAFLEKWNKEIVDGSNAKIRWDDLEEWKIALYIFKGQENIHTLRHPIRFIWVRFTKPETGVEPELAK
ncbi:hypothetical protein NPX13_g2252 [Xylaria arbuscula]|uniref:Uncharacterized protein n=1 Tax=Xylaria arbuscula TaxID=114810 RepID=A0A9W8NKF3_9PEZI|nr:hypothetical protein NPX13_g2252 [Xylaria arbuscula]